MWKRRSSMSTNKEFARLIVLRDKLMVLNNEIEKIENKLKFVKDPTTRNRLERQLKQLKVQRKLQNQLKIQLQQLKLMK